MVWGVYLRLCMGLVPLGVYIFFLEGRMWSCGEEILFGVRGVLAIV